MKNEIDVNENFQILSNLNKEKQNKNLTNTGMNTIKDRRKFVENGINVNFNSITSNSGNNTDINLTNWDSLFQNQISSNSNSKNLFSNSDSRIIKNESLNIKDIKEFEFSPIHKLDKSNEKDDINDSYFL